MTGPHRILIVDDDALVRDSYRAFFAGRDDYEVVGEGRNGSEAIEAYEMLLPDLVVMDLQMPVMSGIEATTEICRRWPDACIVAMTTFGTTDFVVTALRAGAAGYLMKDVGGPGLLVGLQQALNGDMPLSSEVRRQLVAVAAKERSRQKPDPANHGLSPREAELLTWLAHGLTNQQIGQRMFLSEGSVKQYLMAIGQKLDTHSRTGILSRSVQLGIVDPHDLPPLE